MSKLSLLVLTLLSVCVSLIVAHQAVVESPFADHLLSTSGLSAADLLPSTSSLHQHVLSAASEQRGDSKEVLHSNVKSMSELRQQALSSAVARYSLFKEQHAPQPSKHMQIESAAATTAATCPADVSNMEAVLSALAHADESCVKSMTSALAANMESVAPLRQLINAGMYDSAALTRKNALHMLGDLCWSHAHTSTACAQLKSQLSADVTTLLHNRLELETDDSAMNEAIWVLSSFFRATSADSVQKRLSVIAMNGAFSSATRFRAVVTIGILLSAKQQYAAEDVQQIATLLASADAMVRSEAAYLITRLNRTAISEHKALVQSLDAQLAAERSPAVQHMMLEAVDHVKFTTLATAAQTSFENTNLPTTLTNYGLSIRGGLSSSELNCLLTNMNRERTAFTTMMGSPFSTPVSGSASHNTMTLFVFSTRALYQTYMSTYIGYGQNAGGLYMNNLWTLYTYQRTSSQSTISLNELVQHEFGHYLHSRYLMPNYWVDNAFFAQPKAWLDEGTAEFWSGLNFNGQGCYSSPLRSNYLRASCSSYPSSAPAQVNTLINQRAGYDQSGTFDYNGGYFFIYFMWRNHNSAMKTIYNAVRSNTYNVANFASYVGTSITALQTEFNTAFRGYCNNRSQFDKTDVVCPANDGQTSCTVCGHGFVSIACPVAGGSTTPTPTPTPTVTAPAAPTNVRATAGTNSASISFTTPSNGGAAITSYTVRSNAGQTATGASTTITVSGLTAGVTYTFTVTATNSAGTSTASTGSNAIVPTSAASAPSAPTNVRAVAGNTAVAVSFTASSNNGGSAITTYTVISSPGSFRATGANSPITVQGLTNGVSYTFTVTASNTVGTSAFSTASNAAVPFMTSSSSAGDDGSNGGAPQDVNCPCLCCSGSSCQVALTLARNDSNCASTCQMDAVCPVGFSVKTDNGDPYNCAKQATCGTCSRVADSQCGWYQDANGAGSCQPVNSAFGSAVSSCPTADASGEKDMALNARSSDKRPNDGDDSSFWYTTVSPATWVVDLGSSYYIKSVVIRQRYVSKVRAISICNDLPTGTALAPPADAFTTVMTNNAVPAVWNSVATSNLNGVKARFIKVSLSQHYVEAELNTVQVYTTDANSVMSASTSFVQEITEMIEYEGEPGGSSVMSASSPAPYIIAVVIAAVLAVSAFFGVRYYRNRKAAAAAAPAKKGVAELSAAEVDALPSPTAISVEMSPRADAPYEPMTSPTESSFGLHHSVSTDQLVSSTQRSS